ncbi:MAG: ATP-dependent helicase [Hyphomicrobiaceae bacterium]
MSFLKSLNSSQKRAATHGIQSDSLAQSGPLLVIAGAGTGKTTTLASRVANALLQGCQPERILLLTFSRRAASEMQRRVQRAILSATASGHTSPACKISWSGTFHGIGARLLRIYSDQVGLSPNFSIHDREDSADLLNMLRHDRGLSEKSIRFPLKNTCLSIYSLALNAQQPLDQIVKQHYPWCVGFEEQLRLLFDEYVTAKQQQDILDYDDLLLYWAEMMSETSIASDIANRFDHVLVDEYQDTNPLQSNIILRMKPNGNGVTVVGDDAQAIYGFRAATVRNILDFPTQFTPPADVITLDENYRSTQSILDASNAVIDRAREGFAKRLYSQRNSNDKPHIVSVSDDIQQARFISEAVLKRREQGIALKSQAVLFRTSHHSNLLEIELARRNIPFVKFGGLRFLEAAHVKDLIAILRWASNPKDRVVAFRVLQILPGVGPSTAAKAFDRILSADFPFAALSIYRPPSATREIWPSFVELMTGLASDSESDLDWDGASANWPNELENVRTWYQPLLEANYPDAAVRSADLDQLIQIARQYRTRERFLTELTLDPPDATSDEAGTPLLDEDYLILSTIHSAKGQEWRAVFLLNVVDGCLPSDMATGQAETIEEERRLLYVAMTRAIDELYLMVPQRFYVHQQPRNGDRHVYAARTRFIVSNMLSHFEQVTWPRSTLSASPNSPSQHKDRINLKSRVAHMWKS